MSDLLIKKSTLATEKELSSENLPLVSDEKSSTLKEKETIVKPYFGARIVYSLLCFSVSISLSILCPFLPLEMEKKGFDTTYMGTIVSIFAVFSFATSLTIAKLLKVFKGRDILIFSAALLTLSQILFATLIPLDFSETNFLVFAHMLRGLKGVTYSSTYAVVYAQTLKIFTKKD